MEKVVLLGTAGAVVNGKRDNVSLALTFGEFHLLIECGGSAAHKLAKCGIPYETLEEMVITHTHIDHFYGLPGFLFAVKYKTLQQRMQPLRIYCPEEAVDELGVFLDALQLREKSPFSIDVRGVPSREHANVFENERVIVTATPVDHMPDKITHALKITSRASGKTVVYSSDTGYSERLIRLAQGADILFHECAGLAQHCIPEFHSNALQVGKVASKSNVKKLVLIHLDAILDDNPELLRAEVRQNFNGEVVVASDFDEYELSISQ